MYPNLQEGEIFHTHTEEPTFPPADRPDCDSTLTTAGDNPTEDGTGGPISLKHNKLNKDY